MQRYFTLDELAEQLRVEVVDLMALISERKLQAIQIGSSVRIPEAEVDKLLVTCAVVPHAETLRRDSSKDKIDHVPDGSRWCLTRTGRAKFRVSGSVAAGAEIWPGQMRYPIKFPKDFLQRLLAHFRGREFPIGGKFDDPGQGSLGEFIQHELKIKMNPAVYLAALLIDEGYAEPSKRGYIRLPLSTAEEGQTGVRP